MRTLRSSSAFQIYFMYVYMSTHNQSSSLFIIFVYPIILSFFSVIWLMFNVLFVAVSFRRTRFANFSTFSYIFFSLTTGLSDRYLLYNEFMHNLYTISIKLYNNTLIFEIFLTLVPGNFLKMTIACFQISCCLL